MLNQSNKLHFILTKRATIFVVTMFPKNCLVDEKAKSHAMKLLDVPEVRANPVLQPCLITACISRGATNCARSLLGYFHSLPFPCSLPPFPLAFLPIRTLLYGKRALSGIGDTLGISFATTVAEGRQNQFVSRSYF